MATCYYALGETGIRWAVIMKTRNAAGETVNYATEDSDRHSIEFRKPSGAMVSHAAEYAAASGEVSWDQGASHDGLLDEVGPWTYRGVLTRASGAVIKSKWAPRLWVVA